MLFAKTPLATFSHRHVLLQGEADVTVEHISRMNIQQFRHFISNAKVVGGGFAAEKADESFAAMAPLCRVRLLVNQ